MVSLHIQYEAKTFDKCGRNVELPEQCLKFQKRENILVFNIFARFHGSRRGCCWGDKFWSKLHRRNLE